MLRETMRKRQRARISRVCTSVHREIAMWEHRKQSSVSLGDTSEDPTLLTLISDLWTPGQSECWFHLSLTVYVFYFFIADWENQDHCIISDRDIKESSLEFVKICKRSLGIVMVKESYVALIWDLMDLKYWWDMQKGNDKRNTDT